MMNQEHVLNQIPDYVLGLLPPQKRQVVERHTAVCGECQQKLQQENELTQLVRTTLSVASQPANLRLRQLMPTPPRSRQIQWLWTDWRTGWTKQLALTAMLLIFFLTGLNLYEQNMMGHGGPELPIAATATFTQEPTMTLADADDIEKEVGGTAVPVLLIIPSATPSPAPTPLAALAPPAHASDPTSFN
jgi:anti-sigma factor RsiW